MIWLKPFIHWGLLFIQIITALLAIRCWSKSKTIAWKIFIIVWIVTFFVETAGKIIGSYGIHNLWLYNFFYIVFFPGIVLLYTDVFINSRLRQLILTSALGLVIWGITYLLSGNQLVLNTYYITVASTIIIFLALAYLVRLYLDKDIITPLRNDFYYWFSVSFIIYFAFNAVMLGMYTKIIESKNNWLPIFIFYASHIIILVLHLCLWAGFRAALKWMK
ncbi:MAG: hypothetical protein M3352_05505 [Bacteroidota bacterium]|nr:hypothetical protein [Bacteroidota bacterium]